MAVDVAGPFAPGCDQDMGQPRYFLVTTVTVPVRHDKPLIWGWKPNDLVEDAEEGAEHTFQDRQEIFKIQTHSKETVMRQWCVRRR